MWIDIALPRPGDPVRRLLGGEGARLAQRSHVLGGRVLDEVYSQAFAAMRADQLGGDVSTTYAKLPDYPNVAARARRTLGADLKIVYVVREPVRRTVSQHYHMHAWRGTGHMSADIDACVREHPSLMNYSRYAMQLRPWRRLFWRRRDPCHSV